MTLIKVRLWQRPSLKQARNACTFEARMRREDSGGVRLLEVLPGPGIQQCLRLELCGSQLTEAMPGQYCLLGSQGVDLSCSYVSLPGMARRSTVTTHRTQALGQAGDVLDYSGPLGSAWPIPLHSTRLLAITRGEGILALLSCLDEILCWLPWVQVQLSHEGFPHDQLPDDCLHRLSTLSPLPRNSCSGWAQLADQLTHFKPDTVYCCAPAHIARQAARLCWQHGVPAQRIWLRTDQVAPQAERWRSALEGPVQRYDRVLAMLNRPPPPG